MEYESGKLQIPKRRQKLSMIDKHHINGMLSRSLRIWCRGRGVTTLQELWSHAKTLAHLTMHLKSDLYGGDENWVKDDQLVGLPDREWSPRPNRNLSGVRGSHYPTPPQLDADKTVGMP